MAIALSMGHLNSGWLASLNTILEQFSKLYVGVTPLENGVLNGGFISSANKMIARVNVVLVANSKATLPALHNSDFNNGVNFLLQKIATDLSTIVGTTILAPTSIAFPQDTDANGTISLIEQGAAGRDILFRINLPSDSTHQDSIVASVTSSTKGTLVFDDLDITPADITAGFATISAKQSKTGDGTTVVGTVRLKRTGVLSATAAFSVIIQNV